MMIFLGPNFDQLVERTLHREKRVAGVEMAR